jgi:hypothetical protein
MGKQVMAVVFALFVGLAIPSTVQASNLDPSWRTGGDSRACAAPVWSPTSSFTSPGNGRRVLIIGDSLTRESRVDMTRLLRKSGWNPTVRCFGGKRLDWAISQVKAQRKWRGLPQTVIIAMGTNDVRWISGSVTKKRIYSLVDSLGPNRDILWVNAYGRNGDRFSKVKQVWLNKTLETVAKQRPNMAVMRWDQIASQAGIGFSSPIHYNKAGFRFRAEQVVAELNARFGSAPS